MGKIEYKKEDLENITEEKYRELVKEYGKEQVENTIRQVISIMEIEDYEKYELFDKFVAYDSKLNEYEYNSDDSDSLEEIDEYSDNNITDIKEIIFADKTFLGYSKEIEHYKTLTKEEEKECYENLALRGKIAILIEREVVDKKGKKTIVKEPIIDLALLFNSVNEKREVLFILDLLTKYYGSYSKESSKIDKQMKLFLKEYNDIFLKLGRVPNFDEWYPRLKEIDNINYFGMCKLNQNLGDKNSVYQVIYAISYLISRDKMICSNLRLVLSRIKNKIGLLDTMDLISAGNLGLINAVDKFDPEKGFKFSTYAVYLIDQSVKQTLVDNTMPFAVDRESYWKYLNFKKEKFRLEQEVGHSLSVEELSLRLSLSVNQIKKFMVLDGPVASLEQKITDDEYDEEIKLCDIISSGELTPEEISVKNDTLKRIRSSLDILTKREKDALVACYGFDGKGVKTCRETGKILHTSHQRVNILMNKSLKKLRRCNNIKSLR